MTNPEFGATAWGRTWLRIVERTDGRANPQLPKARSLARNHKAIISLAAPKVSATVLDGKAIRETSIEFPPWTTAEQAVVRSFVAQNVSKGLSGDLPDSMLDEIVDAGVLVAVQMGDLIAACTCRSRTTPCVHVLAVLYAFILAIDERPMLALEIRSPPGQQFESPQDPEWIPISTVNAERFFGVRGRCGHANS